MFTIRQAFINIKKNKSKSLFTFVISLLILMFLLLFATNIEKSERDIKQLPETAPVRGNVTNVSGTMENGLKIDYFNLIKAIDDSKYTEDVRYEAKVYIGPYRTKRDEFIIANGGYAVNEWNTIPEDVRERIAFIDGYDETSLTSDENIIIVEESLLEFFSEADSEKEEKEIIYKAGDMLPYSMGYGYRGMEVMQIRPVYSGEAKVVGTYTLTSEEKGIDREAGNPYPAYISFYFTSNYLAKVFEEKNEEYYMDNCSFKLSDPRNLGRFKSQMRKAGFTSTNVRGVNLAVTSSLVIYDELYIKNAQQLEKNLTLMRTFQPVFFVLVLIIGFIASYLLMQSRRNELAIMRSLGTGAFRCFVILMLESLMLMIISSLVSGVVAVLLLGMSAMESIKIIGLFAGFYLLGTALAVILLSRFSVMEILSRTD